MVADGCSGALITYPSTAHTYPPPPPSLGRLLFLGDVFWGRVNSCRADRSVSFRVGFAAVALTIVCLDDLHHYYTHIPPAVAGTLDISLSLRPHVP
jgi:hypothetical protein